MKETVLAGCLLLAPCFALGAGAAQWTYSGEGGPSEWSKLAPEYSSCTGKNQSPIDLTGFINARLKPIRFAYRADGHEVLNNGHTVQINHAGESRITVDGIRFELKQFHFHAPSENLINGKSFPMEGHLVHADKDGNLAVVAVMFREGAENKALAKLWPLLPGSAGEKTALPSPIAATGLLPARRAYYRFNGSLTTPPCSEGVRWLVMKVPVSASRGQIETFAHLMHHPNNRPVQPVNARPVLQ